ncbi:ORF_63 [Adoxophyes orana granulovirus]|uniref:ORF_63 n=1 Tax=Adoxophyes orana granulovirus TaxID=170617 RepID=Q7T9V2_GVAO|nr:ORF_63 [Adoxophyes orana granulovirus]AAP85700.1 ORF_63 [Adoxophyes orana granulovirus]
MILLLVAVGIVCFLLVLVHVANIKLYTDIEKFDKITLYDPSMTPRLDPPLEIILNPNNVSCHKNLTPCSTNAECTVCSESLAMCQEFMEDVILQLSDKDDTELTTIKAGSRLCLALDNRRARSCNPTTGTWILREINNNLSLLCHCDRPGVVTQLNMYDDCTFPVGCQPNGMIVDIYTSPIMCVCDNGYVPELSETNTPYCRPLVMRDVMLSLDFYHRPPCRDGFLPAQHPAFDVTYFRQIGANVCLPDPCSYDPLTNERHNGRVLYIEDKGLVMCQCSAEESLYPVYSSGSMLNAQYTEFDWVIANACVKPLKVDRRSVRTDLKVFWARNSLKSDADIVFQVNIEDVHEPYRVLLHRRLTPHPVISNLSTSFVLKFQLCSALISETLHSDERDVYQGYWHMNFLRTNVNTCPLPGEGECRNPTQCGNVTCSYNPCISNVVGTGYANRCYFFKATRNFEDLGRIDQICVWNSPSHYDRVPVTFYINALGTTDLGYGAVNDLRTFRFVATSDTVSGQWYNALNQLLATYPLYRS